MKMYILIIIPRINNNLKLRDIKNYISAVFYKSSDMLIQMKSNHMQIILVFICAT